MKSTEEIQRVLLDRIEYNKDNQQLYLEDVVLAEMCGVDSKEISRRCKQ